MSRNAEVKRAIERVNWIICGVNSAPADLGLDGGLENAGGNLLLVAGLAEVLRDRALEAVKAVTGALSLPTVEPVIDAEVIRDAVAGIDAHHAAGECG